MAMATPLCTAKLAAQQGQGEAWITFFIKLLYQKKYLGENNATHSMALTVDGFAVCSFSSQHEVGWCSSCNAGLAVQRPAFLVGEVPRLLQFVLFSAKKEEEIKKAKPHSSLISNRK